MACAIMIVIGLFALPTVFYALSYQQTEVRKLWSLNIFLASILVLVSLSYIRSLFHTCENMTNHLSLEMGYNLL